MYTQAGQAFSPLTESFPADDPFTITCRCKAAPLLPGAAFIIPPPGGVESEIPLITNFNYFMSLVGYISVFGGAVVYLAKFFGWIKKPEVKQNAAIDDLKKRVETLERKTSADFEAIEDLKTASNLQTAALLALSKHALNGNDTDALQDATRDLEKYLIQRR